MARRVGPAGVVAGHRVDIADQLSIEKNTRPWQRYAL